MHTTNYEEELLVTFVFQFQNPESVRGLLAKGVSPNVTRESRTSVLMMAAMLPNSDICDALINAGAVVNCRNEQGITPLHCSNTAKAAELLINAGAELEASDDQDMTPLHYAVLMRNVSVIEVLLRHGANYLIPNDKGTSPFNAALYEGGAVFEAFSNRIAEERAHVQTVELLVSTRRSHL